jgi:hypothetical protein
MIPGLIDSEFACGGSEKAAQKHGEAGWGSQIGLQWNQQHEPVGPGSHRTLNPAHPMDSRFIALGASRFRRDRLRHGRHVGVWAPVIACKNKVANDNLALAA